jgi:hypothetical protein
MWRTSKWLVLALGVVVTSGCDPELTEEGRAGCEMETEQQARHGPQMLPGRDCGTCHHAFTAAGTVFTSSDSSCGSGVASVHVELLKADGNVQLTLETNAAGNFFTKQKFSTPYRARVTLPDGTTLEMREPQTNGDCAHCHRVPARDRALGRIGARAAEAPGAAGASAQR